MPPLIDKKCILCIEPAGDICLLLEMMLLHKDINMQHVIKIAEAIAFLEYKKPALIIIENIFTERQMEASIAVIRKKAPGSKLLMISSVGDGVAEKAKLAGIDVFLEKPFSKLALLETALSMLQ